MRSVIAVGSSVACTGEQLNSDSSSRRLVRSQKVRFLRKATAFFVKEQQ